jgi:hypothetical protein
MESNAGMEEQFEEEELRGQDDNKQAAIPSLLATSKVR